MASPKKYEATAKALMKWAESELEHVGRIAAIHDPDLQYSYALSTVNGMAHLKDALYEIVNDPDYKEHKSDLLKLHASVIRVMKHLVKTYKVDLDTIRAFNTRKVLSDLSYLKSRSAAAPKNKTRRNGNAAKPEPKPAVPKPVEPKPVEPKPVVPKPAEPKPARKPAGKPAEPAPTDAGPSSNPEFM